MGLSSFTVLLAVAMFDGPLRIALNPAAVSRSDLGNALTLFVIFPLATVLFGSAVWGTGWTVWSSPRDLRNIGLVALLPVSITLTQILQGGAYSRGSEALRLVEAVSAYLVFRNAGLGAKTFRRTIAGLFGLCVLLVISLWLDFSRLGIITFADSLELGIGRPQIADTLLQSTEMSNIAAEVLLVGLCVGVTSRTSLSLALAALSTLPVAFLFVAMGSIGSYVCLAIVLGIQFYRRARRRGAGGQDPPDRDTRGDSCDAHIVAGKQRWSRGQVCRRCPRGQDQW